MRIPDSLSILSEYGILDEVVRPLMSGKEAQVYLVVSSGRLCVAKVYKDAQHRSFKHRAEYTEGRKVRNSRDQRAMNKRSKHGREQDEAAWRSTEVDMIYRLHAAGVRVPVPYHFVEGVLLMELIADEEGNPAPRLGDVALEPEAATEIYDALIRQVTRMLCAGIVHGDLSDFNVLLAADGPVIIDFPQSVDTAHNANASRLLVRDVDNLHRFLARHVPAARRPPYAYEMWDLFQKNLLTPETKLTGRYRAPQRQVNTASVLEAIGDANYDERKRRERLGQRGGPGPSAPERSASRTGVGDASNDGRRISAHNDAAAQRDGVRSTADGDAEPAYVGRKRPQLIEVERRPAPRQQQRRGNDVRGNGGRGNEARGNDTRGNDTRGNDTRGNAGRGNDTRGNAGRGNAGRGNDARGNDARGNPVKGNDARNSGSNQRPPRTDVASPQAPQNGSQASSKGRRSRNRRNRGTIGDLQSHPGTSSQHGGRSDQGARTQPGGRSDQGARTQPGGRSDQGATTHQSAAAIPQPNRGPRGESQPQGAERRPPPERSETDGSARSDPKQSAPANGAESGRRRRVRRSRSTKLVPCS